METKRHLILLLLVGLLVIPLLNTSCTKRGEDDPFFSLYTRKARVTGEWTVNTYLSNIRQSRSDSDIVNEITTEISNIEAWSRIIRIANSDFEQEFSGDVIRYRIIFDKNGRMTSFYHYQYVDEDAEDSGVTTVTTTEIKEEITGTWDFLVGVDDYKNKERLTIVLEEKKTVTTVSVLVLTEDIEEGEVIVPEISQNVSAFRWANGEMSTVYELRMLKKKEAILEQDINTFEITRDETGASFSIQNVGDVSMTITKD